MNIYGSETKEIENQPRLNNYFNLNFILAGNMYIM